MYVCLVCSPWAIACGCIVPFGWLHVGALFPLGDCMWVCCSQTLGGGETGQDGGWETTGGGERRLRQGQSEEAPDGRVPPADLQRPQRPWPARKLRGRCMPTSALWGELASFDAWPSTLMDYLDFFFLVLTSSLHLIFFSLFFSFRFLKKWHPEWKQKGKKSHIRVNSQSKFPKPDVVVFLMYA